MKQPKWLSFGKAANTGASTRAKASAQDYFDVFPDIVNEYPKWIPESKLPAPVAVLKEGIRLRYAFEQMPIHWDIFNAYGLEYVTLGNVLPDATVAAIQKLRNTRVVWARDGSAASDDPATIHCGNSMVWGFQTFEETLEEVKAVQAWADSGGGFFRYPDLAASEWALASSGIVQARFRLASLAAEWRLYIASLGKDQYVQ